MLSELSIKNFAIIDDLTLCFEGGLTILSGETGAGKSIIVSAINLLLGSRATAKMIRTGADSAEIEALFFIAEGEDVFKILASQGIDVAGELLIRRIISHNDRHRIYINGRLATMQVLNQVTENLAAISGQHEHQQLLNESRHLLILDQIGDIPPLRREFQACYHEILPMIATLDQLKAARQTQRDQIELYEFQKKEIEDAGIAKEEDDLLKKEQTCLKNAEMLYQTVRGVTETLYSGDGAVSEKLGEIRRRLENASGVDDRLKPSVDGLSDAAFRIEDIARELIAYSEAIAFDNQRFEEITIRMDELNRLKRKYGGSLASVMAHLDRVRRELGEYDTLDDRISETERVLEKKHRHLSDLAESLSVKRREASVALSQKIETELHTLKMQGTRFEISFARTESSDKTPVYLISEGHVITETGMEQACFMIAPNVGEALKPLSQIASGGELSRVVLALKSIIAADGSAETLIFDEVDAGIGGETAEVVGKKLAALARAGQVICITHLAQIAAFGDHHFRISKQVENGRTCTRISPLNDDLRLEETARMIGGEVISPAARAHAREMVQNGRIYRQSIPGTN